MNDTITAGLSIGLGAFYFAWVLVNVDGWGTVYRYLSKVFDLPPVADYTTPDVLVVVELYTPMLAALMGCGYCTGFWLVTLFSLVLHSDMLVWLAALGILGAALRWADTIGNDNERDPEEHP